MIISSQLNQSARMTNKYKEVSIYRQYWLLAFIAPLTLIIFWASVSFIKYQATTEQNHLLYLDENKKINNLFDDIFDYITKFCQITGLKISQLDNVNPYNVGAILQETAVTANVTLNNFNLKLFDFTTPEGKVIASTLEGPILTPLIVAQNARSWMTLAPKQPWQIHISFIDKAITNYIEPSTRTIPVGYGITNKSNQFIGTISGGIDIDRLTRKIKSILDKDISLILLDKNYQLITSVNISNPYQAAGSLIEQLKKHDFKQLNTAESNFRYDKIDFSFLKAMDQYPYFILLGKNNAQAQKYFDQHLLPNVIELLFIILLLLLLLSYFKNKTVKPIIILAERAKLLSEGNFNINLPEANSIESFELIKALELVKNTLKAEQSLKLEIIKAHDEIKLFNQSLEEKVEARTKELETALLAKTEFLNNISHEVRTPIQGVTAISEGLVDHWSSFDDETKYNYAKQVANNAKRLFSLVDNILDLSRWSLGKIILDKQQVDLVELIWEMIDECQALYLADKPKIILIFNHSRKNSIPPSTNKDQSVNIIVEDLKANYPSIKYSNYSVELDPTKIKQVLRNLLANAIKFSNDGSITINLKQASDNQLQLVIIDQGVGIPEEELIDIFLPFYQSSRTKTRAGGTGLGLTICDQIIKAHRGKIWASNNQEGGTSFNILIPKE